MGTKEAAPSLLYSYLGLRLALRLSPRLLIGADSMASETLVKKAKARRLIREGKLKRHVSKAELVVKIRRSIPIAANQINGLAVNAQVLSVRF